MTTTLVALLTLFLVLAIAVVFLWGLGAWLVSKARKGDLRHDSDTQTPLKK